MKSSIPIRLIMLVIYGRIFMIVSIRSLIDMEALTSLNILIILKPLMIEVVEPKEAPKFANFSMSPKLVPITIKQSKIFQVY